MDVITQVLEVFSKIGQWFVTFIPSLIDLFYVAPAEGVAGGLTFLGVLAVAGLAISVFFLVMGIIQRFLHFAG